MASGYSTEQCGLEYYVNIRHMETKYFVMEP